MFKTKKDVYAVVVVLALLSAVISFIVSLVVVFSHVPAPMSFNVFNTRVVIPEGGSHTDANIDLQRQSIQGFWASTSGLQLQLETGQKIPVTSPSDQSWGSSITCQNVCTSTEIEASGSIDWPSDLKVGTLKGAIVGVISFPVPQEGMYRNVTETVSIPIHIQIVSQSQYQRTSDDSRYGVLQMLIKTGLVCLVSILLTVLFIYLINRKE